MFSRSPRVAHDGVDDGVDRALGPKAPRYSRKFMQHANNVIPPLTLYGAQRRHFRQDVGIASEGD